MNADPEIAIIISTYNSVEWLKKTLWGFANQSFKNFEILIADDGSTENTQKTIAQLSLLFERPLKHIWHEDQGFRKTIILNKAIRSTKADYLLFTDGDCIPRKDFVETHLKYRKSGCFLSGGYFKLPRTISEKISQGDIEAQRCFDINWLKSNGLKNSLKNQKLTATGFTSHCLNFITPTNASWNGHNSSGWRKDILAVNGFDERMQYGGEDRELGERLINLGLMSKQIRYSAICLHLDHARGYVKEEMKKKNDAIRKATKEEKKTYTDFGIVK